MIHGKLITIGALSFGLVAAGCNQATDESRDTGSVVSDATTDRAAELAEVEELFAKLQAEDIADAPAPVIEGFSFRSPNTLPVLFDAT